MEINRCDKGHCYDADRYNFCPQCAAEAAGDAFGPAGAADTVGKTEPVDPTGNGGSYDKTIPVDFYGSDSVPDSPGGGLPPTEPATDRSFSKTEPFDEHSYVKGTPVDHFGPTMVVSLSEGMPAGFNPVVGWLICIDGPDMGMDYRIHNGYNYIGRSQSSDICIANDFHISHEKAAVIGYDDQEHMFVFGPAGGHNTVRVNNKMVINAEPLAPYDRLTIGSTKLMFVPLCGERFNWNEK